MNSDNPDQPALLGGTPIRPQGPPLWPTDIPGVAEAIIGAVEDGSWGKYHGPHVEKLSKQLSDYQQREHAVLTCSGTAAIELALRGLKVGAGDEVILAAYDFKGNYQDVLIVGATPVLVDVDPLSGNLDPTLLSAAISDATKAIIVSHLHGGMVPMREVMEFARAHNMSVIEDACQMPGARIEGAWAGSWGDVGVFSFGGSKTLTAGRGGALVTSRSDIVQRITLYNQRGNLAYPLSELQAAALIPQLEHLDTANAARAVNVATLCQLLADFPGLVPLQNAVADCEPGYYKLGFWYHPEEFDGLSRERFSQAMRAEGIAFDPGFEALHKIHSARRYRAVGDLQTANTAHECMLTLHHPVLLGTTADIEEIARAVHKVKTHASALKTHPEQFESPGGRSSR
ncbi:L-glutamine:2-deoxy-scyllo-inosose aminotransferase [Symmachiella dynata]|uniref:L-glutamine:2-deoxy-scyllo-inosose aminotransferase n=1 Tax=Symmachiella dynata TaxID=2527995 RepID=A0A517ZPJ3_9PLAN|nr:aminotransferase class I/II-fold pyridoxal phosphate-dependent enzyme [Symmachiella dynata]QDU44398.1 L-glutamine:2-deoxy-scyllo-inosose aminotransferase [Symmachiella dynata]